MEPASKPENLHGSDEAVHIEPEVDQPYLKDLDLIALNRDANAATEREHTMSLWEGLKLYPKAIGWSLLLSTAIIMEGYDTALLSSLFAFDTFNVRYGTLQPDGSYVISAPWRSGLTNGEACGEILGLWACGMIQARFGYKKTLMGALVLIVGAIFITFFAQNLPMLLAGEIVCGLAWGVFPALATAYASDICPVVLRPYLTTYVNLCWVFGELMATGVLSRMLDRTDQWSYRIPFAIQWIWPIPILIGACFAPESPYWLVQKDRISDARDSLTRLANPADNTFDMDNAIALIRLTDKIEKQHNAETRYIDIVKGANLRRTEISICAWLIQQFGGSGLMTYSTVFFEQAGLSDTYAFDMSMAMYALGALGTIASWWMMAYIGRRTLYLYGCITSFILMVIIGACGFTSSDNSSASWAIGSLLIIFTFVYDSTIGPVCYSLVAEIPSTRLKAKTMVVSRSIYCAGAITVNILSNYQMTSTAWDWGAKTGLFWAGTGVICCVWTYFRLPEPNGRTYGELNILFEQGVSARNFKSTHVEVVATNDLIIDGVVVEAGQPVPVVDISQKDKVVSEIITQA
ncbi:hypothetical protein N7528_001374 [Penicillium herquei]|nr:hypothetical protein N7528_001374 [Penicillium herquei]